MIELSRAISCTAQVLVDGIKLLQSGLQVFRDVTGEDLRRRQVLRVFQAFILEPEDVQVYLIALH